MGTPNLRSSFTLADIALSGAKRVALADVLKASGLTIGQALTVAEVTSAANRLASTGLFKNVRFRYVTLDRRMTVTFEVEEMERGAPVLFDNFIWFSRDELLAAVRDKMPSFDGTAPASEGAIDTIRQALTALLSARTLPGSVHYTPSADVGSTELKGHVFSIIEPAPKLCAIRIDGAAGVPPRDLIDAVPGLVGGDYSGVRIGLLSVGTFTDLYRQRGYWKAAFREPVVTFDRACGGAIVVLSVSEGPSYDFERAAWNGNSAILAAKLDALLGVKKGDRANIRTLDDGLREVQAAYGKQGYIMAGTTYRPVLDDSSRRATFEILVREGRQYRMGTVAFARLGERQVRDLTGKWKLKAGDVFDASYPGEFVSDHLRSLLPPGTTAEIGMRTDPDSDLVHLLIGYR